MKMLQSMMRKMMGGMFNNVFDYNFKRMMQEPYTENLFQMYNIMRKVGPNAMFETGMRSETGQPIERPLGSPIVFSKWEKLLLNPVHMFKLPTPDGVQIQTGTTIGPKAKKPLHLEIPIVNRK
jgi:hypothetical protein